MFTLTPSQEAGGLIDSAQPLADALSERLGIPVEPIVPTDYAGVIAALQSGQAQIAGGLGALQMVQAEDEAGADLILQSERFGSLRVRDAVVHQRPRHVLLGHAGRRPRRRASCSATASQDATSPSDGPIGEEHLADVAGDTVAFVDQGSASGYLVPSLELLNAGVDPETTSRPLFAGSHDGAVQAVYDGDAEVGTSFNDARTLLTDQLPDVGEKVVVFAWSLADPQRRLRRRR